MILVFTEDATSEHVQAVERFLGPAGMFLTEVRCVNGCGCAGRRFTVRGAGNPEQEPVLSKQLREYPGVEHVEDRPFGPGAW